MKENKWRLGIAPPADERWISRWRDVIKCDDVTREDSPGACAHAH